jgi:arginyl-tRNA synthetase
MHVGHLRSTVSRAGFWNLSDDVKRINHVGDWGTHNSVYSFNTSKKRVSQVGARIQVLNITDGILHKNAKERFDENADFKGSANRRRQIAVENVECLRRVLCDVSREQFNLVYSRLDVTVERVQESFYNEKIPAIEEVRQAENSTLKKEVPCVFVDR